MIPAAGLRKGSARLWPPRLDARPLLKHPPAHPLGGLDQLSLSHHVPQVQRVCSVQVASAGWQATQFRRDVASREVPLALPAWGAEATVAATRPWGPLPRCAAQLRPWVGPHCSL